jgi:undecaprenyl-phosphate galactose phosphotransferase/putative colanic acid biosynthesis UDP-glucose lipid carrier transferase
MGKIDNIESHAPEFRLHPNLGVSYFTIGIIAACGDFIFIVISNLIANYTYQLFVYQGKMTIDAALGEGIVVAIVFILLAKSLDLYGFTCLLDPSKYMSGMLKAWTMALLLVTAMLFLLRAGTAFSRGSTIVFAALALAPLILLRLLAARALRSLIAQGAISGRRAVVIGEEFELAQLSASALLINFGLKELARISFGGGSKRDALSNEELMKLDYAIAVARQQGADELVIAFDWGRTELIERIEDRLRISPLPVRLLPDQVVRSVLGRRNFLAIGPVPSVELQRAPLSRAERLAKRACDAVLATIALVLLAPLMLLTAVAIKLDSPGPIIFRQRRTGFNERMFFIYKFRTMSVIEDGPQIVQTLRDDPRVTKLGRLLRQSSIDELPQLFNVLKGEMSLVGPRPHAVAHDDHYGAVISSYAYRHHVKPGITGWAQVNGLRGETQRIEDMERRIDLDLWYINNWSLILDFRIIWRTCLVLMRHRGY